MNRPRRRSTDRRGVALLLVLITMAAATTLVMGWLAVQDTSPLLGRNAVRAAQSRSIAQAGLELTVSMLETDAPWRTHHDEGWVLRQHPIAGGVVDVRLWDATADPPGPPTAGTVQVRVEATATIDGMAQQASALATVHPFDGATLGDLGGLALFAQDTMTISGHSRIRGWGSTAPRRMLGIGRDLPGSVVLDGAAARQGTAGADLVRPASASAALISGSGRGGLIRSRRQRPIPDELGVYGLTRSDLPAGAGEPGHDHVDLETPGEVHWDDIAGTLIDGDLYVGEGVTLLLPAETTVHVAGDLTLDVGAAVRVHDTGRATLVVGGDLTVDHATLGTVTPARRRVNRPRAASARSLHVIAVPHDEAVWTISDRSVIAAELDAPHADVFIDRCAVVGRISARALELSDTRLWYDGRLGNGSGLASIAASIDAMDLLDRRDGGLDEAAREAVLARLVSLTHADNTRVARPTTPPNGDAWQLRPVLVQAQMDQFGGDTQAWEATAMANAQDAP